VKIWGLIASAGSDGSALSRVLSLLGRLNSWNADFVKEYENGQV